MKPLHCSTIFWWSPNRLRPTLERLARENVHVVVLCVDVDRWTTSFLFLSFSLSLSLSLSLSCLIPVSFFVLFFVLFFVFFYVFFFVFFFVFVMDMVVLCGDVDRWATSFFKSNLPIRFFWGITIVFDRVTQARTKFQVVALPTALVNSLYILWRSVLLLAELSCYVADFQRVCWMQENDRKSEPGAQTNPWAAFERVTGKNK